MEKEVKNKKVPEEQEDKESIEDKKPEKPEKQPKTQKMDLIIFLLLLIPAIIKDAIEILLGLIPGINFFVWIISLPFTAYIFFITIISKTRGTVIFIGHILDLFPLASIAPIATFTIILAYIYSHSPNPIKKTMDKATKLTSAASKK